MFDIGFTELLICAVIALLVLGPERLPTAARTAGRWVGNARRMVSQLSSELDSELKTQELREKLRQAGGEIGVDDVKSSVQGALDEAKKYEHFVLPDDEVPAHKSAPATRRQAGEQDSDEDTAPREPVEQLEPDEDPSFSNNSGHASVATTEDPPPATDHRSPQTDKRE